MQIPLLCCTPLRVPRTWRLGAAVLVVLWVSSRSLVAQGELDIQDESEHALPEAATRPLVWDVWPLFDPFVSRQEWTLLAGPERLRELRSNAAISGWSFGFGRTVTTLRSHAWLRLQQAFTFRVMERSTYGLSLSTHTAEGGVRFGFLELGVGAGLTPLGVDTSDGTTSLYGLSPRAVANASIKLGAIRIGVTGTEEYLWRWLGRPDALTRGVQFQLAIEQHVPLRRGAHPLILRYPRFDN